MINSGKLKALFALVLLIASGDVIAVNVKERVDALNARYKKFYRNMNTFTHCVSKGEPCDPKVVQELKRDTKILVASVAVTAVALTAGALGARELVRQGKNVVRMPESFGDMEEPVPSVNLDKSVKYEREWLNQEDIAAGIRKKATREHGQTQQVQTGIDDRFAFGEELVRQEEERRITKEAAERARQAEIEKEREQAREAQLQREREEEASAQRLIAAEEAAKKQAQPKKGQNNSQKKGSGSGRKSSRSKLIEKTLIK